MQKAKRIWQDIRAQLMRSSHMTTIDHTAKQQHQSEVLLCWPAIKSASKLCMEVEFHVKPSVQLLWTTNILTHCGSWTLAVERTSMCIITLEPQIPFPSTRCIWGTSTIICMTACIAMSHKKTDQPIRWSNSVYRRAAVTAIKTKHYNKMSTSAPYEHWGKNNTLLWALIGLKQGDNPRHQQGDIAFAVSFGCAWGLSK